MELFKIREEGGERLCLDRVGLSRPFKERTTFPFYVIAEGWARLHQLVNQKTPFRPDISGFLYDVFPPTHKVLHPSTVNKQLLLS